MASSSAAERDIQNESWLAVGSLPDVRLWRNNVGELLDSRGIPVKYGLAVGSADTIGIVAPNGRMLSIEFKVPGYKPSGKRQLDREDTQQAWRDIVNRMGGIAIRCDCVEQALFGVVLARWVGFMLPVPTTFPFELMNHSGLKAAHRQLVEDWNERKPKGRRK